LISRRGALLLLVSLVAGCARMPGFRPAAVPLDLPAAPRDFRLEGRVSVKTHEESFSGGMTWQHALDKQELLLRTPLGQGVAELRGDARGVELRDSEGRSHRAEDAEILVRQVMGVTLPLKGLAWWVVGHVRPDGPYQAEPNVDGRLALLKQDGWEIEFSRYTQVNGRFLPGKLLARRGEDLEIRLVVDKWELP
jgi:outer membrane lipoprotein LolB